MGITTIEQESKLDEALRESFPASDAPASLSELEPEENTMSIHHKIAIVIGSLRKGAYSRMMANALIQLAPASVTVEIVEIGDLSFFNQDLESEPPASWVAFRDKIRPFDAIIFAAPEYNRSIPAPLKNAVDIGSRPPKESVWEGKLGTVVSTSPGALGGISSNNHLRQVLSAVNILLMPQPNVSVGQIHKSFDEEGKLIDEGTKKFLASFMETFASWIEKQKA
jgi:chromate reductase